MQRQSRCKSLDFWPQHSRSKPQFTSTTTKFSSDLYPCISDLHPVSEDCLVFSLKQSKTSPHLTVRPSVYNWVWPRGSQFLVSLLLSRISPSVILLITVILVKPFTIFGPNTLLIRSTWSLVNTVLRRCWHYIVKLLSFHVRVWL